MPRTTITFSGDDEQLYSEIERIAKERDRSISYLLVEAAREVYGDANRIDAHHIDPNRIDAIEDRLDRVEETIGLDEDHQLDDRARELAESVDWSEVTVGRTDDRVTAVARVIAYIRDENRAMPSEIRSFVMDSFDLGLSESSIQRMLSDCLRQIDAIERDGQVVRWVSDSASSEPARDDP